jgi:hypothetical protein
MLVVPPLGCPPVSVPPMALLPPDDDTLGLVPEQAAVIATIDISAETRPERQNDPSFINTTSIN